MRRLVLLCLALCLALPAWADDAAIEKIRQSYNEIHKSLPTLKKTEFESDLQSTEGVQAFKYQDRQGQIKLIQIQAFGEMGKSIDEYYYQNQQVVFVLATTHQYNMPIYIDAKQAKELGMEGFDPKKTKVLENRYYFNQGQLIRWIDENKQAVKTSDARFKAEGKKVLAESQNLLNKAK